MMEAGAVLALLLALGSTAAATFYGDSITFLPLKRVSNGTFEVEFYHRQNGRTSCVPRYTFTCNGVPCTTSVTTMPGFSPTDQDGTGQGRWCQSEVHTHTTIETNGTFSLRDSGCCWLSNVEGKTNWTSHAHLNLCNRSDSMSLNNCPVTATVSSLRVPQNCFSRVHLLAYDPDGDRVKCSFVSSSTVPANISLDEAACTLKSTGQVSVGVHVFEVMLEDFPARNITLTYADGTTEQREALDMTLPALCSVTVQFSLEVLPAIPSCEAGHVQPVFLSPTPMQGRVFHVPVGENFKLEAQSQAHHSSIHDFQVSGPDGMTKQFADKANGKAKLTLSWTPQGRDLHRATPVCFTAETNETQSDMRCVVVVVVSESSLVQGNASIRCAPNKIEVALEKASMPGIDMNYLKLMDDTCSLTSNSTHIIGIMSFTTCGTQIEDTGDYIVFRNEINSFELPREVITRRRTVKIDFYCRFPKILSISSFYTLHKSDYIFTESNFGSFAFSFEIFRNSNFTNKVDASSYPVQVRLMDPIYMGIRAQSEMPNVKLFVESCKGTPDDNSNNPLSYDLVKNGCLLDETMKVYPANDTTYNFEVQSFKFSGNFDQVYISCTVILCDSNSPFSRCAQGCLNSPGRRRRRQVLSTETIRRSITQGPLQFIGQEVPMGVNDGEDNSVRVKQSTETAEVIPSQASPAQPDTKASLWSITTLRRLGSDSSTAIFAVLFLASLLVLAIVVIYFTRKRKMEDSKLLISAAWDE
ncbi:uncharacterized protein LOC142904771 [Nelusetta ayraudi]|uniref:uncharacterized protein LOC142904771 n=1 Tax=Nelusetta ayraudi TaxID=303726 RepID=UPI003F71CF69